MDGFFVLTLTAAVVVGFVVGCVVMAFAMTQPVVREDLSSMHPSMHEVTPARPTLRLVAPCAEQTVLYDWASEEGT